MVFNFNQKLEHQHGLGTSGEEKVRTTGILEVTCGLTKRVRGERERERETIRYCHVIFQIMGEQGLQHN